MSLLKFVGLGPNEDDERLKELINNSYSGVKVVGRGTIRISPEEVAQTGEFLAARNQARER